MVDRSSLHKGWRRGTVEQSTSRSFFRRWFPSLSLFAPHTTLSWHFRGVVSKIDSRSKMYLERKSTVNVDALENTLLPMWITMRPKWELLDTTHGHPPQGRTWFSGFQRHSCFWLLALPILFSALKSSTNLFCPLRFYGLFGRFFELCDLSAHTHELH